MEATIAGEAGVPFALYIGDRHGAEEAKALVPEVATVVVKDGFEMQKGFMPKRRGRAEGNSRGGEVARRARADGEATHLWLSDYLARETFSRARSAKPFARIIPKLWEGEDTVVLAASSVTVAWAEYWAIKDRILDKLKK